MTNDAQYRKQYEMLNDKQREAVDTIDGPVMVVAGPGTGKTQILTLRIANILRTTDTEPEQILALTFTNAGVHAMRERLYEIVGDASYRLAIFTFHAFAEHIIETYPSYLPQFEYAQVASDLDRVLILEKVLANHTFEYLTTFHNRYRFLNDISRAIQDIKQEGLSPEDFRARLPNWKKELYADERIFYKRNYGSYKKGDIKPLEREGIEKKLARAEELAVIYEQYQRELTDAGLYDFSDMILAVIEALEHNPELQLALQEQFHYIHIDEHQDTNTGQQHLIDLLTSAPHLEGKPNVFAVGDQKQSIYRFQGASAETFNHFTECYREVTLVYLERNYRSVQSILDLSHELITNSTELQHERQLQAVAAESVPIPVRMFSHSAYELLFIAHDIKEKLAAGVVPEEIAVIYRKNRDVDELKAALSYHDIPYSILGSYNILDDRLLHNVATLLRVIHNPLEDAHLGEALFIDFLNIPPAVALDILSKRRGALFNVLAEYEETRELHQLISESVVQSKNTDVLQCIKALLDESGLIFHLLRAPDGQLLLLKLHAFLDELKRHMDRTGQYTLDHIIAFLNALDEYHVPITLREPALVSGVQLLTAHNAKGREFEHVYIMNVTRAGWEQSMPPEKILLPISRYRGDLDDERRLLFVAMTRAKRSLSLSFATEDHTRRQHEPSALLADLATEIHDMKSFEESATTDLVAYLKPYTDNHPLLDPEFIQQQFLRRRLNVTALNNFYECPMKYFFRNLLQLPEPYSVSLTYGSAVHAALERFFNTSKEAGEVLSVEHLLDYFQEVVQHLRIPARDADAIKERGTEALLSYYQKRHHDWSLDVGTEMTVTTNITLAGGVSVRLSGKIDRIDYNGNRVRLTDYKTGKPYSEKQKDQKQALERQLRFYHYLLEHNESFDYTVDEAVLDFIEPNKKGKYEQYALSGSEISHEEMEQEITAMVDAVISGAFLTDGCKRRECRYCQRAKITLPNTALKTTN